MAQTQAELRTSRWNAAVPAWIALAGVALSATLSFLGTTYATRNTIKAEKEKASRERSITLSDTQRGERKVAYEKFLVAAQKAVSYERTFWCEVEEEVSSSADRTTRDFSPCADAKAADQIVLEMRVTVATVVLYAGDDTRRRTYNMVTNFAWHNELFKREGNKLRISKIPTASADDLSLRWEMESSFLDIASQMCKEQSLLPNKCTTPPIK